MCNGCFGCCSRRRQCCKCKLRVETLRCADKYHWFERCPDDVCPRCPSDNPHNCEMACRRNRHIVEALSCLFKCSMQHLLSVLFKLAHQQYQQPLKKFPRNRAWSVMRHVKAPYTELNDLEIYDSMYDRCGLPIDPLDQNNIFKILRMLFLLSVMTIEQKQYLVHMLRCLNANAHIPVHLDLLFKTLEGIELKDLVCSLRNQETLTQRFFTARQCSALCRLYNKVATVDKYAVARQRGRRSHEKHVKYEGVRKERGSEGAARGESIVTTTRQSQLIRQFCERKPRSSAEATSSPPTAAIVGPNKVRTSQKITRYSVGTKFRKSGSV